VNFIKIKFREKAILHGLMEKLMKEIIIKMLDTVKEFQPIETEEDMKVNGPLTGKRVLGYLLGLTEINMKAIGKLISKMVRENLLNQMVGNM
jgi:hypothetical protein